MTAMTPERHLWQSVVFLAVSDALPAPKTRLSAEVIRFRDAAAAWIEAGGKDYRKVCHLAGIDPEMLRRAFIERRIDPVILRKSETCRRQRPE